MSSPTQVLKKRAEVGSLHLFVQPIFPQSRDSKASSVACQSPNTPMATRATEETSTETAVEPPQSSQLVETSQPTQTGQPSQPSQPSETSQVTQTEEPVRENERLSELREIVMDETTPSVASGTLPSMCLEAIPSGTLRSTEIKKVLRKMEKVEERPVDVYVSPCRAIVRKWRDAGAYCVTSEGRTKNLCIESFTVDWSVCC